MPIVMSKGQVTLPKWIRDELGLVFGSEVEFEISDGWAALRKKISPEKLVRWQGDLRGELVPGSVDKHRDELRGEGPESTADR